jgi:hypothetical protein
VLAYVPTLPFAQYCSSPARHGSHSRQESTKQPTPTRSPTPWRVTAAPTSLTVPAISWPGTKRIRDLAPLAAHGVDVGVADAGEGDLDQHVVLTEVSAIDRDRLEAERWRTGRHRR